MIRVRCLLLCRHLLFPATTHRSKSILSLGSKLPSSVLFSHFKFTSLSSSISRRLIETSSRDHDRRLELSSSTSSSPNIEVGADADESSMPQPRMGIQFKCKICENTLQKTFTKQSYEHGVVIIRCDHCSSLHLIADNLNWFSDMNGKKNVVDILHAKGETVYRINSNDPKLTQESTPTKLNEDKENKSTASSTSEDLGQKTKSSRLPKIYTKTGDRGTSGLITGERRVKYDLIFDTLGTVDELSSSLGLCLEYLFDKQDQFPKIISFIESIQCRLFEIGTCIATPSNLSTNEKLTDYQQFDAKHTQDLELFIDELTQELEPLKNFILPSGGGLASTHFHLTRAICRRCERLVQSLIHKEKTLNPNVGIYLNRLSDLFFTMARYAAKKEQKVQKIYKR
ncbi:unnamed protein product, partial [Didymodactylos carnosus]